MLRSVYTFLFYFNYDIHYPIAKENKSASMGLGVVCFSWDPRFLDFQPRSYCLALPSQSIGCPLSISATVVCSYIVLHFPLLVSLMIWALLTCPNSQCSRLVFLCANSPVVSHLPLLCSEVYCSLPHNLDINSLELVPHFQVEVCFCPPFLPFICWCFSVFHASVYFILVYISSPNCLNSRLLLVILCANTVLHLLCAEICCFIIWISKVTFILFLCVCCYAFAATVVLFLPIFIARFGRAIQAN